MITWVIGAMFVFGLNHTIKEFNDMTLYDRLGKLLNYLYFWPMILGDTVSTEYARYLKSKKS